MTCDWDKPTPVKNTFPRFRRDNNIIKPTTCSIFSESLVDVSPETPVETMQKCVYFTQVHAHQLPACQPQVLGCKLSVDLTQEAAKNIIFNH